MKIYLVILTHDFPENGFEVLGAFGSREKALQYINDRQPGTTKLEDGSYSWRRKKFFGHDYDYYTISEMDVQ